MNLRDVIKLVVVAVVFTNCGSGVEVSARKEHGNKTVTPNSSNAGAVKQKNQGPDSTGTSSKTTVQSNPTDLEEMNSGIYGRSENGEPNTSDAEGTLGKQMNKSLEVAEAQISPLSTDSTSNTDEINTKETKTVENKSTSQNMGMEDLNAACNKNILRPKSKIHGFTDERGRELHVISGLIRQAQGVDVVLQEFRESRLFNSDTGRGINKNLSGLDLTQSEVHDSIFYKVNFKDSNMAQSNISNSVFIDPDFTGTNFEEVTFENVVFVNAKLGCLRNAKFVNVTFVDSQIDFRLSERTQLQQLMARNSSLRAGDQLLIEKAQLYNVVIHAESKDIQFTKVKAKGLSFQGPVKKLQLLGANLVKTKLPKTEMIVLSNVFVYLGNSKIGAAHELLAKAELDNADRGLFISLEDGKIDLRLAQ